MTLRETFPRDSAAEICLDGRIVRKNIFPVAAGGFADVYEGTFENRKVAIKVVRPFGSSGKKMDHEKLLRRLWREYLTWSRLSHHNILACLGYSFDFSPDSYILPSLISPWMANGTLASYLQDNPDLDRLKLLIGVGDGLSYLHTRNPVIVHGDLRAGNILVSDQGVPCLTDFGLSRVLDEVRGMTTSTEFAGSVRWMSPELFQSDRNVTVHSDVWAYGMTVLEVLSGERPYSTVKSDIIVFGKIKDGQLPLRPQDPEVLEVLSGRVWDTCHQCWSLEPTARPSIEEIMSMIISPEKKHSDPYTVDIVRGHVIKIGFENMNIILGYEPAFCFSGDGDHLAVGRSDVVEIFDTGNGIKIHTVFRNRATPISAMCFSPDSKRLATGSWNGNITILDTSDYGRSDSSNFTEIELYRTQELNNPVHELIFSEDGRLLYSRHGGRATTVLVWEIETYRQRILSVRESLKVDKEWKIMAFSPVGNLVAISPDSRDVYLWDPERNVLLERLPGDMYIIRATFTSDGKMLLIHWSGHGATLWDLDPFFLNPQRNAPLNINPGLSELTEGRGEKGSNRVCDLEYNRVLLRVMASRMVMAWSPRAFVFWDKETGSEGDFRLDRALEKVVNFSLSPTSGMLASMERSSGSRSITWHYKFS